MKILLVQAHLGRMEGEAPIFPLDLNIDTTHRGVG